MSEAVPDIGATGRQKRVTQLSSRAAASKETEALAAAAAAPQKSKARKPQRQAVQDSQVIPEKAKVPSKRKAPVPDTRDSEEGDDSEGPKLTKADRETLQRLLALKKQVDANQHSQAVAGNVFVFFLIL